jgi:hypothetical protein
MKKDNKSDYTINFTRKALAFSSQHTNLNEPEAVKALIAKLETRNGYKRNLCIAYNKFCKHYQIQWTMPKMQITILEQTTPKGDKTMNNPNTKTQGKTSNPMDNQQENKEKILRVMTELRNWRILDGERRARLIWRTYVTNMGYS